MRRAFHQIDPEELNPFIRNRVGVPNTVYSIAELNAWIVNAPPGETVLAERVDVTWLRNIMPPTLNSRRGLVLTVGRDSINLNQFTLPEIIRRISQAVVEEESGNYPDEILNVLLQGDGQVRLTVRDVSLQPNGFNYRRRFSFFPHLNRFSKIDLSRYGIYTTTQRASEDTTHCLVKALIESHQFSEGEIAEITQRVSNRPFPRASLKQLAEQYDCKIALICEREGRTCGRYVYGSGRRCISLGHVENHIFLNDTTPYSQHALEHYQEWESEGRPPSYGRYLSAFAVVVWLLNHDGFESLECNEDLFAKELDRVLSHHADKDPVVETPSEQCTVNVSSTTQSHDYDEIVYFDIEADTNTHEYHIPYAVGWAVREQTGFTIAHNWEEVRQLASEVLKNVKIMINHERRKNGERIKKTYSILCYAHNASYDLQLFLDSCVTTSMLRSGKSIKVWQGIFYDHFRITVHDSWQFIQSKLAEFPEMFGLPVKKEWYPYDHYTVNNIFNDVPIPWEWVPEDCQADLQMFRREDGDLHMLQVARYYCNRDVEILKIGFETFHRWMKDAVNMDVHHHMTLSHLGKNYMISQRCFEDVFALKRHVMEYIRKCVVGGRVMCAYNQPQVIHTPVLDEDVNSLYPYAMQWMPGFLRGKPKVIPNEWKQDFRNRMGELDGIFCRIRITFVGKQRAFPLLYHRENGTLEWTDECVGRILYVCKTSLEDMIEFHEIEFECLDGYYFNEGFNTNIKQVMLHLFQKRKEKKEEGNPIQKVYKLVMNSCYGSTLTKPITEACSFIRKKDFGEFYRRNHLYITQTYELGVSLPANDLTLEQIQYLEERKTIAVEMVRSLNDCASLPHVGAEILAWSKRHMNQIMYLAEDLNIDIYYTDTDSIHIDAEGKERLGEAYEQMYHKPLYGKELGQMSTDWGSEAVVGEHCYFLAKKIYCDVLNDGKIHFKMKGVTKKAVYNCAREEKCTIPELYQKLAVGETLTFHNGKDELGNPVTTFKRHLSGGYSKLEESLLIKKINIIKDA